MRLSVSACVCGRVCIHVAGCVSLHSIAISFETAAFKSIIRLGHHYVISNLGVSFGKNSFDSFQTLFTHNTSNNVSHAKKE